MNITSANSTITFSTSDITTGTTGDVTILASGKIDFNSSSDITTTSAAGNAGTVKVQSYNDELSFNASNITTGTVGNVDIDARNNINFTSGSNINASTNNGQGGQVNIDTTTGSVTFTSSTIQTQGTTQGGLVGINAVNAINFGSGSNITTGNATTLAGVVNITSSNSTVTFSSSDITTGSTGNVTVTAVGKVDFNNDSDITTSSTGANAGTVRVQSTSDEVSFNASTITTGTLGNVDIDARNDITFTNNSDIYANTGSGQGGQVNIDTTTGSVMFTASTIQTHGSTQGGLVAINAVDAIAFSNGSNIITGSTTTSAGTVTINSSNNQVAFSGSHIITGASGTLSITGETGISFNSSNITTQTSTAASAGSVTLRSRGNINFTGSNIQVDGLTGSINGGSVTIETTTGTNSVVFSNSQINSGTEGTGSGGDVNISAPGLVSFSNASNITTTGTTTAGDVNITSANSTITFSTSDITTGTTGDVTILASGKIDFNTSSDITTTSAAGNAGSVKVQSYNDELSFNASAITTGTVGNVDIDARNNILFTSGSNINASTGSGQGGQVNIDTTTGSVTFTSSTIQTQGSTQGGLVAVNAVNAITFNSGSNITTGSTTTLAGVVNITSSNSTVTFSSADITTGSTGNITITAAGKVDFNSGSDIATSSTAGNAGTVKIQSSNDELSFNASTITTGTLGSVDIDARNDIIFTSGSNINASTANGQGGQVNIDTTTGSVSFTSSTIQTQGSTQGGVVAVNAVDAITFNSGSNITTGSTTTTAGAVTLNSSTNQVSFSNSNITTGASGNVSVTGETGISFNTASITTQTSIAAAGTVILTGKGNIAFASSNIQANGLAGSTNGGAVTIVTTTGTNSVVFSSSAINSSTAGSGSGGHVNISAPGLVSFSNTSNITTTGTTTAGDVNITSSNSTITFSTSDITTGTAGDVTVIALGKVDFNSSSDITTTSATGNAGTVKVESTSDELSFNSSVIRTGTLGSVDIDARNNITFTNGSNINATTANGQGGQVNVYTRTGSVTFKSSTIQTEGTTQGGLVTINAVNAIAFNSGSNITTGSATTLAGVINISSSNSTLTFSSSDITTGSTGNITITASGKVDFNSGSDITTSSTIGNAGTVKVQSTSDELSFHTSSITTGTLGSVDIDARNDILFTNGSNINASTNNGQGGQVNIDTTTGGVAFAGSTIQTQGTTQGGLVAINAVDAITFVSDSNITTGSTTTPAGTVTLNSSTNQVSFSNSNITTGASGNVAVTGETGITFNTSNITTQTSTAAAAASVTMTSRGNINFTGSNIQANGLAGSTNGGAVTIQTTTGTNSVVFSNSAINSSTAGTGSGGDVNISAPGLVSFSNASNITTTGTTTAGDVNITSGSSTVTFSNSDITTGTTGDVTILASGKIDFNTSSDITTTSAAGNAGTVKVQSTSDELSFNNSAITTGTVGNVDIDARNNILFTSGSNINASTNNGQGGQVNIDTTTGSVTFASSTIQTQGTTQGGLVGINAVNAITFGNGSNITTGSTTTLAGVVNITSSNSTVTFSSSDITTGSTGNVTVTAVGKVDFNNRSDITTSSTVANAGTVRIQSTSDDISFNASVIRTGTLGNVDIDARNDITFTIHSEVSSHIYANTGSGQGGQVNIDTTTGSVMFTGSTIQTHGSTQGGLVAINAVEAIAFINGSNIITGSTTTAAGTVSINSSSNQVAFSGSHIITGASGNVAVTGETGITFNTSNITTQTSTAASAASVTLTSRGNIHFTGSNIQADGLAGSTNGGAVTIETTTGTNSVVFSNSQINSGTEGTGSGGDVNISAPGLVSFSNASNITTTGTTTAGDVNITSGSSTVTFSNSDITTGTTGDVTILASGKIDFNTSSDITTTSAVGNAGSVKVQSYSDELSFNASAITTGTVGNVDIDARNNIFFTSGSNINASTGSGQGGQVNIDTTTGSVTFTSSTIQTQGTTQGGLVAINAVNAITFNSGSNITTGSTTTLAGVVNIASSNSTMTFSGSDITTGTTGNVTITAAGKIDFNTSSDITTSSTVGNAATVRIQSISNEISFNASVITTGTLGSVDIDARNDILFTNGSNINASTNNGQGGQVNIDTTTGGVAFAGSTIQTQGTTQGGLVAVNAVNAITFNGGSNITTGSTTTLAGVVNIASSNSTMTFSGSDITTGTTGNVTITAAGKIDFNTSSDITTSSTVGNAATVRIQSISNEISFNASVITTGTLGSVDIDARNDILFTNGSNINASTNNGQGGQINIDSSTGGVAFTGSTIQTQGTTQGGLVAINAVDAIAFSSGSNITTGSTTTTAGTVTLNSSSSQVAFSGSSITTGNSGNVAVTGQTGISFNTSNITTQTTSGSSATVNLTSQGSIEFLTSNILTNGLAGSTNGGNVTIQTTTGTNSITFNASVINSSTAGSGVGGNVSINAPGVIEFSNISNITTTGPVNAGFVNITSSNSTVNFSDSVITTGTRDASGVLGKVTIDGKAGVTFTMSPTRADAIITNSTTGNASDVDVISEGDIAFTRSNISAVSSAATGNGGVVTIETTGSGDNAIAFDDSNITTTANTGNAGNVNINAPGIITFLNGSDIRTTAVVGASGIVTIESSDDEISFENSKITTGHLGTVDVDARNDVRFVNHSNIDTRSLNNIGGQVTIDSLSGGIAFDSSTIQTNGVPYGGLVGIYAAQLVSFSAGSHITTGSTTTLGNVVTIESSANQVFFADSNITTGSQGYIDIIGQTGVNFSVSNIVTQTTTGSAAPVTVTSQGNIVFNRSNILTNGLAGSVDGAAVTIQTTTGDNSISFTASLINTSTAGSGRGSSVSVSAPGAVSFSNLSNITTSGTTLAGLVNISSANSSLSFNNSSITSGTRGHVTLNGMTGVSFTYTLAQNAIFTNSSISDAGNVQITSEGPIQFTRGNITSQNTGGTGIGGSVTIGSVNTVDKITFDTSTITTNSQSSNAGAVTVTTRGDIEFKAGSNITTRNTGGTGTGGSVTIGADNTLGKITFDASAIDTRSQTSNGGIVQVTSTGEIEFKAGSDIVTGGTNAGAVTIQSSADTVTFTNSSITTGTTNVAGTAGKVTVNGYAGVTFSNTSEDIAIMTSSTTGSAAKVEVTSAESIRFTNSNIQANTSANSANAGEITIGGISTLGEIRFNNSSLEARSTHGTTPGNGGNVSIRSEKLISFTNDSYINTIGNNAGFVNIQSSDSTITFDDSSITTSARVQGGYVAINALGAVLFSNESDIVTTGNTAAGTVNIQSATSSVTFTNSSITTERAGNVTIYGHTAVAFSSTNLQDAIDTESLFGNGATVQIDSTGSISFSNSNITTGTTVTTAQSGDVILGSITTVGAITFDNSSIDAGSSGDGGSVSITTSGYVSFSSNSDIITEGLNAGSVDIVSSNATIMFDDSTIQTNAQDYAGNVNILAKNSIEFTDSSDISATSNNEAGDVTIESVTGGILFDDSTITTQGTNQGGTVEITADGAIEFTDNANIVTTGAIAGAVSVSSAHSTVTFDNSTITTGTTDGSGVEGKVTLEGLAGVTFTNTNRASAIVTTSDTGNSGAVDVISQGNIAFTNSDILTASLATAGSGGNVKIESTTSPLNTIVFDNSAITTSSRGTANGGDVIISNSGSILFRNASDIATSADVNSGTVDITSSASSVTFTGSTITTGILGNVTVTAYGKVDFNTGADINTNTSTGNSGTVTIASTSDVVEFTNSSITSGTAGKVSIDGMAGVTFTRTTADNAIITDSDTGNAGAVEVKSYSAISFLNSAISARNTAGTGLGGNVSIGDANTAGKITMNASSITTTSQGGNAGSVTITSSGDMEFTAASHIITSSSAAGSDGGNITIIGPLVTKSVVFNASVMDTRATRNAGDIIVNAFGSVSFSNASNILTTGTTTSGTVDIISQSSGVTFSATDITTGIAGNVRVDAYGKIHFHTGSDIVTTTATGNAGTVKIDSTNDQVAFQSSTINTSAADAAGTVDIDARDGISFLSNANINAKSTNGQGGNITIDSTTAGVTFTTSTIETNGGTQGGLLAIHATGAIAFSDNANITTGTTAISGGTVTIHSNSNQVSFDSTDITTGTLGNVAITGQAGVVFNNSDIMTQSSVNAAATVSVNSEGNIQFTNSDILARGLNGSTNGGAVTVQSTTALSTISFQNSDIDSSSVGSGNGGNINVLTPGAISFSNASHILTTGTTLAGSVLVRSENSTVSFSDSTVTTGTTDVAGNAGKVTVNGQSGVLFTRTNTGNAIITESASNAASVEITSLGTISFLRSNITTQNTAGTGIGGNVTIGTANTLGKLSFDLSRITTSSQGGNAGSVIITSSSDIEFLAESDITARSSANIGNGGNITISSLLPEKNISFNNSNMDTRATGTTANGGDIAVYAIGNISFTNSSDITTAGTTTAGSVNIESANAGVVFDGSTITSGTEGDVTIHSQTGVTFTNTNSTQAIVTTSTVGNAGDVQVVSQGHVGFTNSDIIATSSADTGDGGDVILSTILVPARDITFASSIIDTRATGATAANGGDVEITATGEISFSSASNITTTGTTTAGTVNVISSDSGVTFSASDITTGIAGNVRVQAYEKISFHTESDITTATVTGNAGSVTIDSTNHEVAFDDSQINTSATATAGSVDIDARNAIGFLNNANINTKSTNGQGGSITIDSATEGVTFTTSTIETNGGLQGGFLRIQAVGAIAFSDSANVTTGTTTTAGGTVTLYSSGNQVSFEDSDIVTGTLGNVNIMGKTQVVFTDSDIITQTSVNAAATVAVTSEGSIEFTRSDISAQGLAGSTNGGNVTVQATLGLNGRIAFEDSVIDTTSVGTGNGGNVNITAPGIIEFTDGSDIITTGTTTAGLVNVDSSASDVEFHDSVIRTGTMGKVTVNGYAGVTFTQQAVASAIITTSATGNAGDVEVLSQGNIAFTNSNIVTTSTAAVGNAGDVVIETTIGASNTIAFNASSIDTRATGATTANGGYVILDATGAIQFQNASHVFTAGTTIAGTVDITSRSSDVSFSASAITTGIQGNVEVNAYDDIAFQALSHITTTSNTGNAGTVRLDAMVGGISFNNSIITTGTLGDVDIDARTAISFANVANIDTRSNAGQSGNITIDSLLNGVSFADSTIQTNGVTQGGSLSINAVGAIAFSSSSDITTGTTTTTGGVVNITSTGNQVSFMDSDIVTGTVGNVAIHGQTGIAFIRSNIVSQSNAGQSGSVSMISYGNIDFSSSDITSSALAIGTHGGSVTIQTFSNLNTIIFSDSAINSSSTGSGNGGNVSIAGPGRIEFNTVSDITTTSVAGNAGTVTIHSGSNEVVFHNSKITTGTNGTVDIDASSNISFTNAANIDTHSTTGQGGNITIDSATGTVLFDTASMTTTGTNLGGTVSVRAVGAIAFQNNSPIVTTATNAGTVTIASSNATVSFANTNITTGNAGHVSITSYTTATFNAAQIATQSAANGGNVTIVSNTDALAFTNSSINANATANGNAGNVTLTTPTASANQTIQLNATPVFASAANNGTGGIVTMTTRDASLLNGSHIDVSSANGNGGQVILNMLQTLNINASNITATGTTGGMIDIDAPSLQITGSVLRSEGTNNGGIMDITTGLSTGHLSNSTLITDTMELRGNFVATNTVNLTADQINLYNRLTSGNGLTMTGTVNVLATTGELRSSGRIVGNLVNSGRVAPENTENGIATADLSVTGNFTSQANSHLEMNVNIEGSCDTVTEVTNVNIADNAQLDIIKDGFTYQYGSSYNLIMYDGLLTKNQGFTFDPFIDPVHPVLRFAMRYPDGIVQLYIRRSVIDQIEYKDPRAATMAASLEPIVNGGGGQDLMNNVLPILDSMTVPQLEDALVQMGSESFDAYEVVHISNTNMIMNVLTGELQGIPGKELQEKTKVSQYSNMLLAYEGDVKSLGMEKEKPAPSEEKAGNGIFAQFLGGYGKHDEESLKRTGFDYRNYGFVVGGSIQLKNITLGLHTGYLNTSVDFDDTGSSEGNIDNIFVGVHSRLTLDKFFVNAMAGYMYSNYENERRILFSSPTGTINRTAKSDFDGNTFYASLSTGYDFSLTKNLILTPIASMSYLYNSIEEIKETGANDLNLIVEKQDIQSLRSSLGARLAYRIKTDTMTFIPEVRFLWMHEFIKDNDELGTVLAGNPNNPMEMPTARQPRDSYRIGTQFSAFLNESFTLRLEYDADIQEDYTSHLGKATLLINF